MLCCEGNVKEWLFRQACCWKSTSAQSLQLTTVKWPVLSSLSAMCILQLTIQKAVVGSRTAISSWRVGSTDTFTWGNEVGIFPVWARLHCMNISLIWERDDDSVQDEARLAGGKRKKQCMFWRELFHSFFPLSFWRKFYFPDWLYISFGASGNLYFHPFPCTLHSYGFKSCMNCISSPKERIHCFVNTELKAQELMTLFDSEEIAAGHSKDGGYGGQM